MEYNIYEKCRFFDEDAMECAHPDCGDGPHDYLCEGPNCDSLELECPHCKKMIDVDDLWAEDEQ